MMVWIVDGILCIVTCVEISSGWWDRRFGFICFILVKGKFGFG